MPVSHFLIKLWFPLSLLSSPENDYLTNYSLAKAITPGIYSQLCQYLYKYFDILQRHMYTEYEVQIQDNCITPVGQTVLQTLHMEYDIFQHEIHIKRILEPWHSCFLEHPYSEDAYVLLASIIGRVLATVDIRIQWEQEFF